MTYPITSSKLVLIPHDEHSAERPAPVRRYRLARLKLDCRSSDPASRFEHLKRIYD